MKCKHFEARKRASNAELLAVYCAAITGLTANINLTNAHGQYFGPDDALRDQLIVDAWSIACNSFVGCDFGSKEQTK